MADPYPTPRGHTPWHHAEFSGSTNHERGRAQDVLFHDMTLNHLSRCVISEGELETKKANHAGEKKKTRCNLLVMSQRHSLQHPQPARKSKTRGHSGNGDSSQILEIQRVEQILRVRVDVDGLLLDGGNLGIEKKKTTDTYNIFKNTYMVLHKQQT